MEPWVLRPGQQRPYQGIHQAGEDDIIRAVNQRPVHTAADALRELRLIAPGRPIFLTVWRSGTDVFLKMRKE